MEEDELLCLVKKQIVVGLILLGLWVVVTEVKASSLDTDERQVSNMLEASQKMIWENLEEKYSELLKLKGKSPDNGNYANKMEEGSAFLSTNKANLYVFVSSSMPEVLLKAYRVEAEKYDAIIVLNGLPGGSFKELASMVMKMQAEDGKAAMQIDDEAFRNFGIKKVPSFVLSKRPDNCMPYQSCGFIYDKVEGNVGIKAALELIARDGDLAVEAKSYLE